MKLIHLGTKIISEFGIIDDNGNLVQNMAVTGENNGPYVIKVFTPEAFADAFQNLDKARSELIKQVDKLEQQADALKAYSQPKIDG